MNKSSVQRFVFLTTVLNFIAIVGLVAAEGYVRWKLNQNFTFLGDSALSALILLFGAQTLGLVWSERK